MAKHTLNVNTARFLNYVWPFYSIIHERVNRLPFFCNSISVKLDLHYQQQHKRSYELDALICVTQIHTREY